MFVFTKLKRVTSMSMRLSIFMAMRLLFALFISFTVSAELTQPNVVSPFSVQKLTTKKSTIQQSTVQQSTTLQSSLTQSSIDNIHIELELNNLRFYDEILSHSLRNYAFTREEKWLARYFEFQQLLDQLILSLSKNDNESNLIFNQFNETNNSLYVLESQIIELIKQENVKAAIDILEGQEYTHLKKLYEKQIEQRLGFEGNLALEQLLTKNERDWLNQHRTWRIGIDPQAQPFEFMDENLKHSGISSNYMQYIAEVLNVDIQLQNIKSWSQVIAAVKTKDIDVLPLAVVSESRKEYLAFTNTYLNYPVAIITQDTEVQIKQQADLTNKSVVLMKDYAISETIQKKYKNFDVILVDSIVDGLKMVSSGKANALILDVATATFQIRKSNIVNLKVAGYIDINAPGFSVAVRKDWYPLVSIINKVLAKMPANKKIEFNRRWVDIVGASVPSKRINISSQEQAWLDATPSIRVMSETGQIPYDFTIGGKAAGYSIDYLKLLAKHIGLKLEFVKGTKSEHIDGIKTKSIDLLHSLSELPVALNNFVSYSQTYKTTLNALITRATNKNITSMKALEGSTFALLKRDTFAKHLEEKVSSIDLLLLDNNEALLKAVAFGRADATKVELPVATHLMRTMSLTNLSIIGQINEHDDPSKQYRLAVRKDWPELISLLNKAINALTEQELQQLNNKWLALDNKTLARLGEKSGFFSRGYLTTAILIMLSAAIIILLFFRLLERTKSNPLFFQFSSPKANRMAISFNVAIIFIAVLLGWWALGDLREKITKDILASLQTVLETTEASTTIWAKGNENSLADLASNPRLISIVETLVTKHNNSEALIGSNAQMSLRMFLTEIKRHNEQVGFFVIASDGVSIGSMRDENLEILNLIVKNRPDLFQQSMKGATLFIPPIPSDISLPQNGNGEVHPATMFFTTPVRNSKNEIIAILAERHDPYGDFSELHQLGRIGDTGETYAVSSNGKLLTESRFLNQLRSIGLVSKNARSILTVDIKVPQPKTSTLVQKRAGTSSKKLTTMAKSLIAGNSDFDTQGYLDYRGVNVIGVWAWNNQLGIGTVTEIDFNEAYEGYFHTRNIIFIILLVTLSASVALTLTIMLLGSRANRALLQAHDSLEERVLDRTSKLQASEQKLKESEERFDFAIRASNDGVWDWDYLTGEVYYSDRWFSMLGYEPEEKAGSLETWSELCHPDDVNPTMELIEACTHGSQDGYRIEFRMLHKKGYWVPILSRAYAVRDPETKEVCRFVGTHIDLTQQKIDEAVLRQAKQAAEEASQAKSDFLATMSHEIRTPLNGVLGMLSLVINTELSVEQSRKLNMANQSAQSLLNIINDVLDFSKIESGKLELEYVDFDPVRLLENLVKSMAFKAEEKGVELLIDTTQLGSVWINGDPLRLKQIIINLVGNAIKFTENGDILLRAEVQKLADEKLALTIAVIDSGIGIPQNKLSSLFNSFTQADTSTTRKYGGTGLGLAISKKLVSLMGGSIHVESDIGKGSTFEFTVPVSFAQTESALYTNIDMSKLSILIVDDNATNREIYATHLQYWGIKTTEAASAKEAYLLCDNDNCQFDIALLDMHMPEKSGETLAKELKQLPVLASMKLMLLTSMSKQQSNEEISALGFDGYLSKPVAISDLFNAIVLLTTQRSDQLKPSLVTEASLESHQQLSQQETSQQHISNEQVKWSDNTRILVVEDNRINQLVVKGMLELHQLTCDFAFNGLEALESLKNSADDFPYTLIFMDCQMPELDGYEATRCIRRGDGLDKYKTIPIIAMTAHAMKDEMAKCLDAGMDDYLAKPLDLALLEKMLLRWCDKQEVEHPILSAESDLGDEINNINDINEIVWDKSTFERRLSGNQMLIAEIVELYLQNIESKLSEFSQAISKLDRSQIKDVAHAIKGMSGNLSALQVQSMASAVESNALHLGQSYLETMLANIVSASKVLELELCQFIQEQKAANVLINGESVEKQAIDIEKFRSWADKLEYRLKNGEFVTKDIFESIEIYLLDDTLVELIDQLKHYVFIFDFDNAVKTLKKISQQL